MSLNYKTLLIVTLLTFGLENLCSQESKDAIHSQIVELDPEVRYGKLPNGFTYYLRKNNKPSNTIEFHFVVKAGLFHEDDDQLDYSHLTEHMGAKGTKHFPDVKDYFRTMGRFTHASTGTDHTKYWIRILSRDKQAIDSSLQLTRDWANDIDFKSKSIDVEREAVLAEKRIHNPYRAWVGNMVKKYVLEHLRYPFKEIEDFEKSIENFNKEAFLRYHEDWYRPDLQAVIIVGDINVDSMQVKVREMFSDLKMAREVRDRESKLVPYKRKLNAENQFARIEDTINTGLSLYLISKQPNYNYRINTKSDFKKSIIQKLVKNILKNRADQTMQRYHPPFTSYSLNYGDLRLSSGNIDASLWVINLSPDNEESQEENFKKALIAWKRIHSKLTPADLITVKGKMQEKFNAENSSHTPRLAANYRSHFIAGNAAPNPKDDAKLFESILSEISLKEVNEIISLYGNLNKNKDFLFFNGVETHLRDLNLYESWVEELERQEIPPWEPSPPPIESLEEIVQFPSMPKSSIQYKSEDLIGITSVVLNNGVKLYLKPSSPVTERYENNISIYGFKPNKISIDDRKEYLNAAAASEIINYSGAGPYDGIRLKEFKSNNEIKLNFKLEQDFQIVEGNSHLSKIQELINLLYLYTTNPNIESDTFEFWKGRKKNELEGKALRAGSNFYLGKIDAIWNPDKPILTKKELDKLSERKIRKAFKEWFSHFTEYTFIITGDFQSDELLELIAGKISSLPVKKPNNIGVRQNFKFPVRKIDDTIKIKNLNQVYVSLYFPLVTSRDLKTRIELKILSKALGERIWDRLRNGCYAPRAGGNWVDIENDTYAFNIHFDSELGNESNLIQNALEEFRKLRDYGVNQKWLDSAIENMMDSHNRNLEKFGIHNFWKNHLIETKRNGEDLTSDVLQYNTLMGHFVSLEDINKAAKEYLTEENIQKFIVLPDGFNMY